jgi:hypothetical protein
MTVSLHMLLNSAMDDRGFESRQRLGIFLYTTASRPALRPTQRPIQCVPGALSLGVKWQGREADHSPPSSAEMKNAWCYASTPQYAFMVWCSVLKHRDNLICAIVKCTWNRIFKCEGMYTYGGVLSQARTHTSGHHSTECGSETSGYKTNSNQFKHCIYLNTVFKLIIVVWAIIKTITNSNTLFR